MNKLNKYILAILFTIPTSNIYAACSGASCCSVSSGVVTIAADTSCDIEPDIYTIVMKKFYLCTSEPSAPTASATVQYTSAGCVQIVSSAGSTVAITPGGDAQTFPGATFTRPPNDTYTHGVILMDNVFTVNWKKKFNARHFGGDGSQGLYCATVAGSGNESDNGSTTCSDSSALTGGSWASTLRSFDGSESDVYVVTRTNLNNTGSDIAGYLVTSAEKLTTSKGAVTELIGIQSFANPVTVTKDFKGLNFAFGVNQGSHIWDSDGGVTVKIEAGGGPFQVILSPLNY
jgi:hypothetical protein